MRRALAFVAVVGLASGCSDNSTGPNCNVEAYLSHYPDEMLVGDSLRLVGQVRDYCFRNLEWTIHYGSQDPSVATVDASGLIVARSPGQTLISIRAAHGSERASGGFNLSVVTDTVPSPRVGSALIYDPATDDMILFGGWDEYGQFRNDLYCLPLSGPRDWSSLYSTGARPTGRAFAGVGYDPVRHRMLLFGGYDWSSATLDVWALDLAATTWARLSDGPAFQMSAFNTVYDPLSDRLIAFDPADGNRIWELSTSGMNSWNELVHSGSGPPRRGGTTSILDPVRNRILVFGGNDDSLSNDTWELSLSGTPRWNRLGPTGALPGPRAEASGIYDPVRDRMIVFSGYQAGEGSDVWALSLAGAPTWSEIVPQGTQPAPRARASTIHDPVRDRMILFGGVGVIFHNALGDTWGLTLGSSPAWEELMPPFMGMAQRRIAPDP